MTRSLINTPRTLESFDSMYSSMRSSNNCFDNEQIFNIKQQQRKEGSCNSMTPISAEGFFNL
jgi:hypothetical protein